MNREIFHFKKHLTNSGVHYFSEYAASFLLSQNARRFVDVLFLDLLLIFSPMSTATSFERTESIREEIAAFKAAATADNDTVDSKAFARTFFAGDGLTTIDRFIVLVEECLFDEVEESARRDRLVEVLVHTIYSDDGETLLQALLFSTVDVDNSQKSSAEVRSINQNKALQTKLISILVGLPELALNRLGDRCPPELSVNSYLRRLLSVLKGVLQQVHASLSTLTGLSLLNLLIGRLCLKGHSALIWECLFASLTPLLLDDLKWLQITRRVLLPEMNSNSASSALSSTTTTTSMFIEGLLKMAFFNAPCHQVVVSLFKPDYLQMVSGKGGHLLTKVHFLLTNKFLLIHYQSPVEYASSAQYHPDQFLWNIFTYLSVCQPDWMVEAVTNLLDTWSNGSAFKSRPYFQHCFLARALVIATKVLLESSVPVINDHQELFQHLQRSTMTSIELHLKSNQTEFRAVGFAAATIVMNAIARFNKLNIVAPDFETSKRPISNEESVYLKALGAVSVESIFEKKVIAAEVPKTSKEGEGIKTKKIPPEQKKKATTTTTAQQAKPSKVELDSDDDDSENDDDLQPYDLSNDIAVEADIRFVGKDIEPTRQPVVSAAELQSLLLPDRSRQPPVYLQDLVEGLAQTEKPLWAERCLQSAEKIIRANFDKEQPSPLQYGRLHGSAHALTRLLFHLDNHCAIPNFAELRSQALAALAVGAPKIAASYLAEQFYSTNRSLSQRMDVLAVLAAATVELTSSFKGRQIKSPVEETDKKKKSRALLKDGEDDSAAASKAKFVRMYLENGEDSDDDEGGDKNENWRQVVAERIKVNTRLIAPASLRILADSSTAASATSTNAFVPVAGHFFFPLLHRGDGQKLKEEMGLRLAEDDSFLLEQLLYTLGLMVQSAANYPVEMLMAKELLAFMAVYRGTELR